MEESSVQEQFYICIDLMLKVILVSDITCETQRLFM